MKIAIDFDGTIVEHMFPEVGAPVPGAISWMKKWKEAGAKLILWTMRSDGPGEDRRVLTEAVKYCEENGIVFDAINEGIGDRSWTNSQKAHAHVYVDDAAFGCPLIHTSHRPMVNWGVVGPQVMKMIEGSK